MTALVWVAVISGSILAVAIPLVEIMAAFEEDEL